MQAPPPVPQNTQLLASQSNVPSSPYQVLLFGLLVMLSSGRRQQDQAVRICKLTRPGRLSAHRPSMEAAQHGTLVTVMHAGACPSGQSANLSGPVPCPSLWPLWSSTSHGVLGPPFRAWFEITEAFQQRDPATSLHWPGRLRGTQAPLPPPRRPGGSARCAPTTTQATRPPSWPARCAMRPSTAARKPSSSRPGPRALLPLLQPPDSLPRSLQGQPLAPQAPQSLQPGHLCCQGTPTSRSPMQLRQPPCLPLRLPFPSQSRWGPACMPAWHWAAAVRAEGCTPAFSSALSWGVKLCIARHLVLQAVLIVPASKASKLFLAVDACGPCIRSGAGVSRMSNPALSRLYHLDACMPAQSLYDAAVLSHRQEQTATRLTQLQKPLCPLLTPPVQSRSPPPLSLLAHPPLPLLQPSPSRWGLSKCPGIAMRRSSHQLTSWHLPQGGPCQLAMQAAFHQQSANAVRLQQGSGHVHRFDPPSAAALNLSRNMPCRASRVPLQGRAGQVPSQTLRACGGGCPRLPRQLQRRVPRQAGCGTHAPKRSRVSSRRHVSACQGLR